MLTLGYKSMPDPFLDRMSYKSRQFFCVYFMLCLSVYCCMSAFDVLSLVSAVLCSVIGSEGRL